MIRKSTLYIISCILATVFLSCAGSTYKQGAALYETHCANCHMPDGTGLEGLIPPLKDSDYYRNNIDEVSCIMVKGMKGKIVVNGKTYDTEMEGIPQLTDTEIANILNYINAMWYPEQAFISPEQVIEELKNCY
jgi:mono/diheme cytochrome c family protein